MGFEKVDGDTIVQRLEWESTNRGPAMLKETRTLRFLTFDDGSRGVDLTVALTPAGDKPVTLKDTKEAGLCSLRLPKPISDNPTLTNAAGQTGEKDTWGKPAAWCDISGQINAKPYGVAVLDHPSNPRHPTRWHVRAYGLLSANPFGLHDYDKSNPPGTGNLELEARHDDDVPLPRGLSRGRREGGQARREVRRAVCEGVAGISVADDGFRLGSFPLVVPHVPPRVLLERLVDQREQVRVVVLQLLARVDVVVVAVVLAVGVEVRLHALGPVLLLVRRGVRALPQPGADRRCGRRPSVGRRTSGRSC